jgi:peptidoglycan hydrolase-like protein with peptidoglycan-binding domain
MTHVNFKPSKASYGFSIKPIYECIWAGARDSTSNESVSELSRLLNAQGYYNNTTGPATDPLFGDSMTKALKAFQAAKGLRVDGVAGPSTWNALGAGTFFSRYTNCTACAGNIPYGTEPLPGCATNTPTPGSDITVDEETGDPQNKPFYKQDWFMPAALGVVGFGAAYLLLRRRG